MVKPLAQENNLKSVTDSWCNFRHTRNSPFAGFPLYEISVRENEIKWLLSALILFARDFKWDSSGNSLVQSFFTDLFKLLSHFSLGKGDNDICQRAGSYEPLWFSCRNGIVPIKLLKVSS